MDFYRDQPKKKSFQREKCDPDVTLTTLKTYLAFFEKKSNQYILEKNIFETTVRFEIDEHVYGANFLAAILEKLVKLGIITNEFLNDFRWKPPFSDLIAWVKRLILVFSPAHQTVKEKS